MKNKELVSIIMPAYNASNYIQESIDSVIAQTYSNWELLIIDDGSTDATSGIIKRNIQKDNRIKLFFQENSNQAIARNLGISKSKGELLAFLDSDDVWLSNKLQVTLENFDSEVFDLIFTESFFTSDSVICNSKTQYQTMGVGALHYQGDSGLKAFIQRNRIPILTVIVKKKYVIEINNFDSKCVPAEDYDLWMRLLLNGCKFQSIDIPLSIYRVHNKSSTANDKLATISVLKLLHKNLTSAKIDKIGANKFIKSWLVRWINLYFTRQENRNFKKMLKSFDYYDLKFRVLFLFSGSLPVSFLKFIYIKMLNYL